ncbi:septum formation family protein [Actinomadura nitritigenes]|uniref:DUF4190 domain-containing protein n=1 Tax=Actinomadura nitritigenes TaxID=134602 RepID=UPI003D8E694F
MSADDDAARPPVSGGAGSVWAPPDAALTETSAERAAHGTGENPASSAATPEPVFWQRTNGWAKGALAAGLFGLVPFAVGFAIAAFVQTGRRDEKGRGMAVGGLAASVAWILVGTVVIAAGALLSPERDEAGHITKSGKTVLSQLKVGDCFTGFGKDETQVLVTALPCTRPHDGEIVAEAMLSEGGISPGEEGMEAEATKICTDRLEFLLKSRYYKDLQIYVEKPDMAAWENGDRHITCAMRYTGAEALTAPLATTIDQDLKALRDVDVGDCFAEWEVIDPVAQSVPCTGPHKVEVYAMFYLSEEGLVTSGSPWEYPGRKVVGKYAAAGCDKRADKVFAKNPPPVDLENYFWAPSSRDWYFSQQKVVCLVQPAHGTLKKSVLGK